MAEIKPVNGRAVLDYMARDSDSLLRAMRERIPELLPEWTDYAAEADFGNVLLQAFAYMGDILSYYQDRIANESFLGTAQTRRSIIQHLRLIGYRLGTAAPATATLTLLLPNKDYVVKSSASTRVMPSPPRACATEPASASSTPAMWRWKSSAMRTCRSRPIPPQNERTATTAPIRLPRRARALAPAAMSTNRASRSRRAA